MYTYNAHIIDVHDGDTATAVVDLGFHIKIQVKVRFKGINTPELKGDTRSAALISKKRVEDLILNKDVIIITDKDKQEKYGRWLGTIYLLNETKSVNALLVEEGLAVPFM